MKAKIEVDLEPIRVPNFILQNTKKAKFALKDLDVQTLDMLCNQFRKDVFEKADKLDPQIPQKRKISNERK